MSDPFGDAESGFGAPPTRAPPTPWQADLDNDFGDETWRTPADSRTVRQIRQQRARESTTARLRRVSTALLSGGGRDDADADGFGEEGGRATGAGRRATEAPPTNTSQFRKFVRETPVPDSDMLGVDVTLRKEDYGAPGSSDYRKNMAMATSGLSEKFGVARHKIIAGGEEGDHRGGDSSRSRGPSAESGHGFYGYLHRGEPDGQFE
jgi:hypothetical protein